MGFVINPPKHIGTAFFADGGAVCQRTDVMSDHDRIIIVVLELQPLRFIRQLSQLIHQFVQIFHVTASLQKTTYFNPRTTQGVRRAMFSHPVPFAVGISIHMPPVHNTQNL